MPLKMYESSKANARMYPIKNIVGIAAGKGGVGKSSITVNLARALKSLGFSVGVLDTDIYGPSIRKMLPEDRLPGRKGDKILPALSDGMKVLSLAYFRKEHEAAAIRAPIANGVITQFLQGVDWGELDYLLIDFPPGTGDIQLTLSQQANLSGALMVTTPQDVAVMDVKKAMSLFDQVKIPILGVVENMSYYALPNGERDYIFGKGGGKRLALESGVPFLGQIPMHGEICMSGDTGQSIFLQKERLKILVDAFMLLAENVNSQVEDLKKKNQDVLERFELVWKEM